MSNFVIVYRWHEGSTALVDLLGKHPNVQVPIFEHLDFDEACAFASWDNVDGLVDHLFATGDFETARAAFTTGTRADRRAPGPAIGFKWRIWGDPERIARVLRAHDVTVFHVFRLDALELAVSTYFSTYVVPELEQRTGIRFATGSHPQFGFAELSREQQDAVRRVLHAHRFAVPKDYVVDEMEALLTRKEQVCDNYIDTFRRCGVPVHAVFYEDFVRRREALLRQMCRLLGLDPEPLYGRGPWYQKVASKHLLTQVENIDTLCASSELRGLERSYHDMIRAHHLLVLPFDDKYRATGPAAPPAPRPDTIWHRPAIAHARTRAGQTRRRAGRSTAL
jgi:hypothetical protein